MPKHPGVAGGDPTDAHNEKRQRLHALAAAFLLSLAVDFLLHGGLLAALYERGGPFLLQPSEAFRRIPMGYLGFLALTAGLQWLIIRLGVRGAASGLKLGAATGLLVWGALLLGLYSISTAPAALLLAWWAGQAVELGVAGAVLGAAESGTPRRSIWSRVLLVTLACVIATVALQAAR